MSYFKHDLNSWRDPKLIALRSQGGHAAEGCYWAVVCYVHDNHRPLDSADRVEFTAFCHELVADGTCVMGWLSQLCEVGLLYEENGAYSSRRAEETVDAWEARGERSRENGAKGGRPKKDAQASETQGDSDKKPRKTQRVSGSKPRKTQTPYKREEEERSKKEEGRRESEEGEHVPAKRRYGLYNNVELTDDELATLKAEFPDWQQRVERLSEYIASSGKRYKSHLATIRAWARSDARGQPGTAGGMYAADDKDGGWLP